MKLITEEVKIPELGSQDGKNEDAIVYAKFFCPWNQWTWLVLESDGETCFGLVKGFEVEYGYFSVSELESVKGPLGMGIERDILWTPCDLKQAKQRARF